MSSDEKLLFFHNRFLTVISSAELIEKVRNYDRFHHRSSLSSPSSLHPPSFDLPFGTTTHPPRNCRTRLRNLYLFVRRWRKWDTKLLILLRRWFIWKEILRVRRLIRNHFQIQGVQVFTCCQEEECEFKTKNCLT